MKNLHTSILSVRNEGRVIVPVINVNNDIHWIDAAEAAQFAGITTEQFPVWLNSMYEMGVTTVSDIKTH